MVNMHSTLPERTREIYSKIPEDCAPIRFNEIAELFKSVSKTTITKCLNNLVLTGMVERESVSGRGNPVEYRRYKQIDNSFNRGWESVDLDGWEKEAYQYITTKKALEVYVRELLSEFYICGHMEDKEMADKRFGTFLDAVFLSGMFTVYKNIREHNAFNDNAYRCLVGDFSMSSSGLYNYHFEKNYLEDRNTDLKPLEHIILNKYKDIENSFYFEHYQDDVKEFKK